MPDFKVADREIFIESNPSSITLPSIDFCHHVSPPPSPPPVPITKAIRIEQEFDDFKSFKIATQGWALSDPRKFTFCFKKSDGTRNTVFCVHANTGCPFKVSATYSVVKEWATVVAVADVVRTADPEATAILATEDRGGAHRFHRFFVCPDVSRHAFEYCRCFLIMDGALTKEIFRLTVLLALSVVLTTMR